MFSDIKEQMSKIASMRDELIKMSLKSHENNKSYVEFNTIVEVSIAFEEYMHPNAGTMYMITTDQDCFTVYLHYTAERAPIIEVPNMSDINKRQLHDKIAYLLDRAYVSEEVKELQQVLLGGPIDSESGIYMTHSHYESLLHIREIFSSNIDMYVELDGIKYGAHFDSESIEVKESEYSYKISNFKISIHLPGYPQVMRRITIQDYFSIIADESTTKEEIYEDLRRHMFEDSTWNSTSKKVVSRYYSSLKSYNLNHADIEWSSMNCSTLFRILQTHEQGAGEFVELESAIKNTMSHFTSVIESDFPLSKEAIDNILINLDSEFFHIYVDKDGFCIKNNKKYLSGSKEVIRVLSNDSYVHGRGKGILRDRAKLCWGLAK